MGNDHRKKGGGGWLVNLAILLLAAVAITGICLLGQYGWRLHTAGQRFERLAAQFDIAETKNAGQEEGAAQRLLRLREINEDLAGWVYIEDTDINYPVMYLSGDSSLYLHRDFEKKKSPSGTPFLDGTCSLTPPSDNLIVYGHHMKDGSMFAGLLHYEEKAFWEAHPAILFHTIAEGRQIYEVMSAFAVDMAQEGEVLYYMSDFTDSGQFSSWYEEVKARSLYDTGVTADYSDSFLTLSTCAYHTYDGRFLVVAKKKRL